MLVIFISPFSGSDGAVQVESEGSQQQGDIHYDYRLEQIIDIAVPK